MSKDGDALPDPSSLEQIMEHPEHRGGVAILIPLPDQKARSVRVNIT